MNIPRQMHGNPVVRRFVVRGIRTNNNTFAIGKLANSLQARSRDIFKSVNEWFETWESYSSLLPFLLLSRFQYRTDMEEICSRMYWLFDTSHCQTIRNFDNHWQFWPDVSRARATTFWLS
jgi:hypothetical protein